MTFTVSLSRPSAFPVTYDVVTGPPHQRIVDVREQHATQLHVSERDAPRQVAPGARICVLADPDGNRFCVIDKPDES